MLSCSTAINLTGLRVGESVYYRKKTNKVIEDKLNGLLDMSVKLTGARVGARVGFNVGLIVGENVYHWKDANEVRGGIANNCVKEVELSFAKLTGTIEGDIVGDSVGDNEGDSVGDSVFGCARYDKIKWD